MLRSINPWWKESKSEVAERVVSVFQAIDSMQLGRLQRYAYFLSLYENKTTTNLDNYAIESSNQGLYNQESKENIIRPAVDSLTAKISTNTPRLVTQTNGADFKLRRNAQQRTLLIEGVLADQKGYKLGRQVFRDGCIWDFGAMKIVPNYDEQRVTLERLLPHEVVVDEYDGRYMAPRSLYTIRMVPKSVLYTLYPKMKKSIDNAGIIRDYSGYKYQGPTEDQCEVIEAWHLPSSMDATDGRFVCATSAGELVDCQWTHDVFPIAIWRWKTRQIGFRGFGAVEDIENYQKQLDFLDETIGKLLNNMTVRVWVQDGTKVNTDELTNDTDGFPIGTYVGERPQIIPDPGPPDALFMERERKKAAAFEQLGISMLSAQSKKPAGLNAGVAIREVKDTESERFEDVGQQWDEFYIEVAEKIMIALEDLNSHIPNCRISVPTGDSLSEVSLSKVDWQRERYKIQVKPSGILPREPAGRLQTIQEMVAIWPQATDYLASQLNGPDVDDAMSMVSAPVSAIRSDIEAMLDGEPRSPEPFLDLQLAIQLTLQSYQKLRSQQNVPEEILEYLIAYMQAADDIIKNTAAIAMNVANQQAQQAQMTGPPGMIPAGPGKPPIPGGM